MLKLIVNADDFGNSNKVNESIQLGFEKGIIGSASLMANGKSFSKAVEITKACPELDVGIHLSLTQGRPILNQDQIKSLVNQNTDCFYENGLEFAKHCFLNDVSISEVKNEFTAQCESILDHGIKITHIDSHQHIHMLPKIFDVVSELAKKFEITYIRIPDEKIKRYMFLNINLVRRLPAMIMLNRLAFINKEKVSRRIERFTGFYFGGNLNKKNLIELINYLPDNGTCELMCHPGFEEKVENKSSHYLKLEETEALMDHEVKSILRSKNIEIVSFRDLIMNRE
jgi:predicted glycoside hydrolase/deacetylase ChbG (UPF0249 family)